MVLRDDGVKAAFPRVSEATADTIDQAVRVVEPLFNRDDLHAAAAVT